MDIPNWIFEECERLGYCKKKGVCFDWDKGINPAWMIFKLILKDRKRRKRRVPTGNNAIKTEEI